MGEPFPSPGDLPNRGIEPRSPTLQVDSLPAESQGKPFLVERQLMPTEIRGVNRPESCSLKQEDLICRTLSLGFPSFLRSVSGPKT